MTIYERALDFVHDGDTIGLGSGRAATAFIELLGQRVAAGLRVRGVPTSRASEEVARDVGIPVVSLDDGLPLAVTVDGADEVDGQLNLIKGYGRALVREKIVAAASRRLVILVGQDKLVERLGDHNRLPIEVVPFAVSYVRNFLSSMGMDTTLYEQDGTTFLSDNANMILDAALVGPIVDPTGLESTLRKVPGVVGTGLFLQMAEVVLVGDEINGFALLEERTRNRR